MHEYNCIQLNIKTAAPQVHDTPVVRFLRILESLSIRKTENTCTPIIWMFKNLTMSSFVNFWDREEDFKIECPNWKHPLLTAQCRKNKNRNKFHENEKNKPYVLWLKESFILSRTLLKRFLGHNVKTEKNDGRMNMGSDGMYH